MSESPAKSHATILIVDFGSQVTQLIARRVRETGVYSEVVPFQNAEAALAALNPGAIILSGGPASVPEGSSPRAPQQVFEAGVPVLGICYGQMAMAEQLGGRVESGHHREFGRAALSVDAGSRLFEGVWNPRREARRLDEPWRPHHRAAAGLQGYRNLGERALRSDRG